MGNSNSCCVYANGSTPRHCRDTDKKGKTGRLNGHFKRSASSGSGLAGSGNGHGALDEINGAVSTHPGPGLSAPQHEESCGNLQHISEREPDDWETDPSLHPTTGTLFMEKSKQSIHSE